MRPRALLVEVAADLCQELVEKCAGVSVVWRVRRRRCGALGPVNLTVVLAGAVDDTELVNGLVQRVKVVSRTPAVALPVLGGPLVEQRGLLYGFDLDCQRASQTRTTQLTQPSAMVQT